jgi:RNA polymerase sigma-70 factor (ECF subfamily)
MLPDRRVRLPWPPELDERRWQADHLYETSRRQLCATAARYAGHDAEDIVQEAFLRAIRFGQAFRGDSAPLTWLHRIVVNESIDYCRKRARRERADLLAANHRPRVTSFDDAIAVRRALGTLSVNEYRVFVMYELIGRSHREIAALLSIPVGTSKWRLARARARLQQKLSNRGLARRVRRRPPGRLTGGTAFGAQYGQPAATS